MFSVALHLAARTWAHALVQAPCHNADLESVRAHAANLTPREQEVFERVAEGQANKVVAIDLSISERTVEIHRSQVMQKMQARNLADLVKMKILLDQHSP